MSEELENDTLTNEDEQDITPEPESNEALDKANEVADNQKIRAEKAEKALKELQSKAEKTETPKKEVEKSDEPDYARLAFLESKGITNPDDKKIIQDEASRLNLPLTDIMEMEHIKSQLKTSKTQREAEDGMPEGSGKKGGGTKNSVEYWVDKTNKDGGYENPPNDPELTIKVVNARMEKERKKQEFPD